MAARQAWLLALAVTCTAVLGLTEQAEAGVSTGVLEDPPIHEGGSFKQIPGTPAGTAVYKEKRMPNMAACTALCDAGRFTSRSPNLCPKDSCGVLWHRF